MQNESLFEIIFTSPATVPVICTYKNTHSKCGVLVVLFHFGPIQNKIPHNSSKNLIAWNDKNKWTEQAAQ